MLLARLRPRRHRRTVIRVRSTVPTFEELAVQADEDIDVALGAALIARDAYPTLDVASVVERIDTLAAPLAGAGLERLDVRGQAEALGEHFRALGFRGNSEDYYDPKNSLLPDVMDRRLGIPITLSVVYCEIARRVGVVAQGVAFPGHFLVRVEGRSTGPVVVDAFDGARIVDDAAATALLRRALGEGATLHASLFAPATPRAILVRMLTNLKAVYANRGDHARAFVAIDRIVTLEPRSARMLRERAGVALRLGAAEIARADLAQVLAIEPEAPDVPQIKERLAELRGRATLLH